MNCKLNKDKFLLVDFPAKVVNDEKALEMIGGLQHVSECVQDANKRMELRFRPKDTFCKPTLGDRTTTCSMILKVTKPENLKNCTEEDLHAEIVGVADQKYTFTAMSDFQYLPIEKKPDGSCRDLQNDIVPDKGKLIPENWLSKDVPLLAIPPVFSRFDQPSEYAYRNRLLREDISDSDMGVLIDRKKREIYSRFAYFPQEDVPTEPNPCAVQRYKEREKGLEPDCLKKVEQAFTLRPLWTKHALQRFLNINPQSLKLCLPICSYYWETGPWRAEWCRFEYDPRKDPEAVKYQLLDFRTRESDIAIKRNAGTLPQKIRGLPCLPAMLQHGHLKIEEGLEGLSLTDTKPLEWQFVPGFVPVQRVVFYQLCDVHLPIVKDMLDTDISQIVSEQCSERNGWLPDGFLDEVRSQMVQDVETTLAKLREKSPDPDENDDDEFSFDQTSETAYAPETTPVTVYFPHGSSHGEAGASNLDTSFTEDDSDAELESQRNVLAEDSLFVADVDLDTPLGDEAEVEQKAGILDFYPAE